MRKLTMMMASAALVLSLAACSTNKGNETVAETATTASQAAETTAAEESKETAASQAAPETIVVSTLNGAKETIELEVPYDPQRVAVLDMAVLDMLDNWNLGDRIVGMPKTQKIDYLMKYNDKEEIVNLGTVKEVDMEALMETEPDLIFIGGRLSSQYDALSEIAPVVFVSNDYEKGIVQSTKDNAAMIASIFGKEDLAKEQTDAFDERIATLAKAAQGKTAVIGMVTSSNFSTLGNGSRGSLIGREAGFTNLAVDVDSTHGNESSFELLVQLDPDYIFVLDRDMAIQTEGAKLAQEIMENELVQKIKAYQNGNIVYLTPSVWYLAEGGITAMDIMIQDLENGLGIS